MRGTVASEGLLTGFQPTVVRGYGLVVGLKGTGSRLIPAEVRAMMLAEMARRGVGDPSTGWGHMSPEALLDSEDTAIVIVEGVIPPGASEQKTFDVRVFVIPGSTTTSLEGGRLYSTDLRPGPISVGSKQAFALATAHGDVFINPFVEPGSTNRNSVNRLSGRILNGGEATGDMPVKLRLATTSHARAATIQNAINSSFPREPGQKDDTAHGESGDSIQITVPPSYHEDTEEFMQLLRHTSLQVGAVEATSQAIRRALLANPGSAHAAQWRWCALGPKAVPMIQDLYDHAEESPRLAALSAGARLDDALVVPHLLEVAEHSPSRSRRLSAIKHLGNMGVNPRIDLGLRELLANDDLDIRLAVFDAMLERRDPLIYERWVGKKFVLTQLDSDHPMIYVSQTGVPRLTVFGNAIQLARPMTLHAWSGRLIMKADDSAQPLQVFYRPREGARATIVQAPDDLASFARFLGHETTINDPAAGLNLGYGEVIAALHELWRKGYLPCDFKAEQDRVLASILASEEEHQHIPRPEFETDPTAETFEPTRPGEAEEITPVRGGLDGGDKPGNTVPR